jgi:hypothetical protein
MSGRDYTVEFRIFSETLDSAKITRELGLQPCQIGIEGAPGFGGRLQHGMWAYSVLHIPNLPVIIYPAC